MRKIAILLTTILLTGGVFTSCENFLSGGKIKKEIDDQIALANAPSFPILIDGTKGKFSPSKGSYPLKVTQGMDISFESDTDFGFIRWEVFNARTGESLDTSEYIEIADSTSDKTSIKLLREPESEIQLGVRSIVTERPQIISYTPITTGTLKDSTIQVLFNYDMDPDSIYYTEDEINSLLDGGAETFLSVDGGRKYGYVKDGETFFKNIRITNNKTGQNIIDRFCNPVFENPRVLSIVSNKDAGHTLDDYTQVLVRIEKGFFYTEQEKNVEMAGSKMWMYQVNNKTDAKPLVITNQGGNDLFTAKLSDETQLVQSASFAPNQSGFESLQFSGDGKLNLDINVRDPDGGSGPNSYFTLNVKKLYGENYSPLSPVTEGSCIIDFQNVTSDEAVFEGRVDLKEEGFPVDEGVYELSFEFKDRSNNSMTYPSDGKFYFAVDTKAPEMTLPLVKSEDSSTYTFECNDCIDLKSAQIVYTKAGSEMTPVTMNKDSSDSRYRGEISSIAENKAYDIKIRYTDYAGHVSEKTVPKFLTGFTLTGSPDFTGANASHAENVFFAGDKIADYGITAKKYYSDGSSVDVSSSYTIPTRSSYNSSWDFTYTYSEGSISKSPVLAGTYYIAQKDALTQKPVWLHTDQGWQMYKFGDYPQDVSLISEYTSDTVYNGWYLGSDGYFYEKCTANVDKPNGADRTMTNGSIITTGTTYYFKVQPITWRLLSNSYNGGSSLLFANKNLDQCCWNNKDTARTIDGASINPNNYKYSTLRAFLNGKHESGDDDNSSYDNNGFLQKAFTSSAQKIIRTSTVENTYGSNPYSCDTTYDKIFALSIGEIKNTSYGFPSDSSGATWRTRWATDYAMARHVHQDTPQTTYASYYWLRSPNNANSTKADFIFCTGKINAFPVVQGDFGIIPALCVSASDLP